MAKFLYIAMSVFIVLFFTLHQTSSQEIDQYSQEVPEDVKISPTSDFDIYVESPDESSFEEADSPGEGKPVLLAECCGELLKIGKDCYLGIAQIILSSYEYINIASKAIPKSKQTWNDCIHVIENWNSGGDFDRY
ncbi:hypothetical protein Bca4012_099567 [Brassica carinata]|uniref:(rape) hypothetical protein n=1 Tax=Brassica napus TaxID=3708 RepID=A0A078F2E8_BRANA|nr:unnamed protein product [Brassica napus]CDY07536.1 BnaC06g15280D [Brassica napus]